MRHSPQNGQPITTRSPTDTFGDAVADRLDDARTLVAEHTRGREGQVAVAGDVVGVTDAARGDADDRLAGSRLVQLDLLDLEVGVELRQDRGRDAHQPTAARIARAASRCAAAASSITFISVQNPWI